MTTYHLRNGAESPFWPAIPRNVRRSFRRKGLITARQQRVQMKAQKAAQKRSEANLIAALTD